MSTPGRQGLTARIRQIRRTFPPAAPAASPEAATDAAQIQGLQQRIAHLEQLVQGLQDSVYREARRHDKRIEELEARLEPGALAAELSKDARDRGL